MAYLDATDAGLAASKAYVAAAAARAVGSGGVVLDLGCGLGHDLARLEAAGLTAIGLDTSAVMLGVARRRRGPSDRLVQADGAGLPFASGSLDGCRIERVLQHVEQPEAVVAEVRRVLRPGGFVAIFEPDYLTFRVESDVVPDGSLPASMLRVRHPAVGGRLVGLLSDAGFRIEDVVTESSRGYSVDLLPIALDLVLTRAVADGRLDGSLAARWTDEQRRRTSAGTFRARWDKVLVIAGAPEADEVSD